MIEQKTINSYSSARLQIFQKVISFLNWLLPQKFIDQNSEKEIFKARIFIGILALGILTLNVIVIVLLFNVMALKNNLLLGALWLEIFQLISFVGCYSIFYLTSNFKLSTNVFSILILLNWTTIVAATGGSGSDLVFLLLVVPVVVFLIANKTSGFIASLCAFIAFSSLFFIEKDTITKLPYILPKNDIYVEAVLWVVVISIFVMCLTAYDLVTENLRKLLNEEKEKLRKDAQFDSLTDCYNRETFLEELNETLKTTKEKNKVFVVICIIIENFSEINDRFGYQGGDLFLKTIADRIRGGVNERDFFCRYSTSSFAILFEEKAGVGGVMDVYFKIENGLGDRVEILEAGFVPIVARLGAVRVSNGKTDSDVDADEVMQRVKDIALNQKNSNQLLVNM